MQISFLLFNLQNIDYIESILNSQKEISAITGGSINVTTLSKLRILTFSNVTKHIQELKIAMPDLFSFTLCFRLQKRSYLE